MIAVIIIFGVLTVMAGFAILINPEVIFGLLRRHAEKLSVHVLAVLVRLVLGVLLIAQAAQSRFPLIIEILGWLTLVAAAGLAVIGRPNFKRLMFWALSIVGPVRRVGGVLAAAFGAFLVYAFL